MNNRSFRRKVAILLLGLNIYQCAYPTIAFALTSGPSQPEMQQFSPIGTSDMVDLFSGDFQYNIPLLDVEGYPINISYASSPAMDQEASWVGLGWNINPGLISRDVRGIPDDFKGEGITTDYSTKDNITVGIDLGGTIELAGFDLLSPSLGGGIYYNNYQGFGINYGLTFTTGIAGNLTADLGLNYDSQSGVDIKPSIGFTQEINNLNKRSFDLSAGINSRQGMQYMGLSTSRSYSHMYTKTLDDGTEVEKQSAFSSQPGNLTGSVSVNFNSPVLGPSLSNPTKNYSFSFRLAVGAEAFGTFPDGYVSGNFYREYVADNTVSTASYGQMYSEVGAADENAALDFAREKDITVRKESKNLAIPYATFDVFNIMGHDVGGSYHISRNDVGVYRDAYTENSGFSASGGLDFGAGAVLDVGADVDVSASSTTTSGWTEDNLFKNFSAFTNNGTEPLYEPYYFNNAGEVIVKDRTLYDNTGKSKASRVGLDKIGSTYLAKNLLINQNIDGGGSIQWVGGTLRNLERVKRQQVFSTLNAYEASQFAVTKNLESYDMNTITCSKTEIGRLNWPSHHISEVTVTKGDGMRYVFGIPAYNISKREVTFNIEGMAMVDGLVTYSPTEDASFANERGKDHMYNAQSTPAYAHSYLLTEVLSADYVDNTGNGVSPDDRGKAYKINYSRVHDKFAWRTPIEEDKATFSKGLNSVDNDDKASYVFGEKEIWLTHSIESKNMVAIFFLNEEGRNDALGVVNEHGGKNIAKKLYSLDRISLYSKADLQENGANATPIKTVHFEYSYDLCQGVPNQVNTAYGKLTLTGLYFTYGNSTKGKLNKYKFHYEEADSDLNPDYNSQNYDRWGTYKNQDDNPSSLSNEDFPYTIQDTALANEFAAVWSLRSIDLPSGGTIEVTYESDDYAYVMNKRAAQMFIIDGFGNSPTATPSNKLYDDGPNNYVFLTVPVSVNNVDELQELYLDGLNQLYYKCFVDVNHDGGYEYITGYAQIDSCGLVGAGPTDEIWIKLQNPSFLDEDENPIAYASWQFLRLNIPEKAYPGSDLDEADAEDYILAVVGIFPSLFEMIVGFNNVAKISNKGKLVNTGHSFIRLNNPTFQKLGGGSRVKKIVLYDNWNNMVPTQETFQYGQEYSYTKEENGRIISSGVASYEPVIGREENPFVEPLYYEEKKFLAPDNTYYAELPLGESLYPNASVGYSKVTVRNLQYDNVKRTATGYSVSEFYTAREFPTISYFTNIEVAPIKPNPILKILNLGVQESLTASQGFVVETNDMHGKPKFEAVYNEMGALISSKKYDYQVDDPNAEQLHLSNNCSVVYADGSIDNQTIGMDYDLWQDMRQQKTNVLGGGVHFNNEFVFLFLGVFPLPSLYPSLKSSETMFRSSATTKLIKRAGILSKLTVNENGSEISTENLLYDAETGQVVLTKVTNEFKDPIYKFTYPAHWIYDGMGPSYRNIGAEINGISIINGSIGGIDPNPYLVPGDELIVFDEEGIMDPTRLYVIKPASLRIVDKFGRPFTKYLPGTTDIDYDAKIKIVRSGRRNMSTIPVGNFTSLETPVNNLTDSLDIGEATKLLSADATLYSELWKIDKVQTAAPCDTVTAPSSECLAALLNALFSADLYDLESADSLTVNEILDSDSASCAPLESGWGDEFVYLITPPIPAYNFKSIPSGVSVTLPAFYTLQYQLGDCIITLDKNEYLNSICPPYPFPFTGDIEFSVDGGTGQVVFDYGGPAFSNVPGCADGVVNIQCISCEDECLTMIPGDTINPYVYNILGVWRPVRTYAYHTLRTPDLSEESVDIRTDGVYEDYDPFYSYDMGSDKWNIDTANTHWIWVEESKLFDKYGNAVQSKNALDIHSSALYGYNKTLPAAVTSNAQLKQTANDNFEDYDFDISCNNGIGQCKSSHFSFENSLIEDSVSVSGDEYHSGNYSLKIVPNAASVVTKDILNPSGEIIETLDANKYVLGDDPFIPEFSPSEGSYLISGWVMVDTVCNCKTYGEGLIDISFTGSATTYGIVPTGPIIEGWQRFEQVFDVPADATQIHVTLSGNESNDTYFDDIRIHPFLANMKTYVYDRVSLRLMAQLDENNYATFYEYDEEGNLVRVKRETERGVVTVQEGRSHLKQVN